MKTLKVADLVIAPLLIHSLALSLTYSLTHSFCHSLTDSLILSLIHSLTHSLTLLLIHSLTHPLTHLLTYLFTYSYSLTRSLTHSLTHSGIVLLLTCLPTSYQRYDEWMTIWIATWQRINHNPTWDLAWLTLFTRARKFTKSFDWNSLKDYLFTKSRQLMKLPVSGSVISHKNIFPFSVGTFIHY